MTFKEYRIDIGGVSHTFQLPDGEEIPAGGVEVKAKTPENKQRTPQNKQVTPKNRG